MIYNNFNKKSGGLSSQERQILNTFLQEGRSAIKGFDLIERFDLKQSVANKILSRLEKKGWLQRVKRGLYIFVPLESLSSEPLPEDPWILAQSLFSPCYISGWSAAEYWDMTEQIFNTTVVYTSSPQRKNIHTVLGLIFRTRQISKNELFGTVKIWHQKQPVEVADLHRTIIDILDTPELGGGGRHTLDVIRSYWQSGKANKDILFEYALRLKRGTIFKRLGFIAETVGKVKGEWIKNCQRHISSGISKFDPSGSNKGRILTRWNLRINIPIKESF